MGRDRVSCLSLSRIRNSMRDWWWSSVLHTHLFLTGANGHVVADAEFNSLLASASEKVVQEFLKLLTGFLHRTLSSQDLTPQEKQQWVQSGLALSPLVATCTQYSVDFCLASALIGEWTSRILFPVQKGCGLGMDTLVRC